MDLRRWFSRTSISASRDLEKNENVVTKVFAKDQKVTNIVIDPNKETADVATENNVFPRMENNSRFNLFQSGGE